VRLIEIASHVDGIDDGDALLQQSGCMPRPFDLTIGSAGYARGAQKEPLRRSQRQCPWFALQYRVYSGIERNQAGLREPPDKNFGVLEARIVPCGPVQPERATLGIGQGYIVVVAEASGQELWHKYAQLETNAEPFTVRGTVHNGCLRLRSSQSEKGLTSQSRQGHLKMTRRDGDERAATRTVAPPNSFNKRRI